MKPLNYGLTPKMKPLPPERVALVAAIDVGPARLPA